MTTLPFPEDQIVEADPGDADQLSCLIAEAFHSLAVSRWLIPDEEERRSIFPGYFARYVQDAMAQGTVLTTAEREAVALWVPVAPGGHEPAPGYGPWLAAATGEYRKRFEVFDEYLDARHPADVPHEHLAILAVDPKHQRCGIGSALLRRRHRDLDQAGTAAYLEASNADSRMLYLRHGYTDLDGRPINLPSGPPMYPMLRPAHAVGWPGDPR